MTRRPLIVLAALSFAVAGCRKEPTPEAPPFDPAVPLVLGQPLNDRLAEGATTKEYWISLTKGKGYIVSASSTESYVSIGEKQFYGFGGGTRRSLEVVDQVSRWDPRDPHWKVVRCPQDDTYRFTLYVYPGGEGNEGMEKARPTTGAYTVAIKPLDLLVEDRTTDDDLIDEVTKGRSKRFKVRLEGGKKYRVHMSGRSNGSLVFVDWLHGYVRLLDPTGKEVAKGPRSIELVCPAPGEYTIVATRDPASPAFSSLAVGGFVLTVHQP